ncbi:MAG TPA: ABC transporter ATP-binding protein [Anaerolineales bacterium]|nr:ABC transporter ATP-binding protein [Anaerolineales bacterium]
MAGAQTASEPQAGDYRARMLRRGPGRPGKIEKAANPRRAMLRLLPYLSAYKAVLMVVFVLILVATGLGLLGPYLMGLAIDRYIAGRDPAGLVRISIWILVIFLTGNASELASNWLMARVSQDALKRLRQNMFDHMQTLTLSFFDRNPAGELMSRLTNDIEAINQAVSQNVVSLFASVLSLVGILAAMFILNFWLALASVFVVPLMFWFTNFIARYTRKGFRELQKQLGEMNSVMEEAISGQRVIKAFRRSDAVIEAFQHQNQLVYKASVYANSYALSLMPLTNQLGNLFVITIAGLGGWLALRGLATVGTIVTFISYGRSFISPLRQLANMYNNIQAALAGAERVFEIIDEPSELGEKSDIDLRELRGQVSFENVHFSYTTGTPVIRGMSLNAQAGQIVALIGPTGAGKTTMVNLLSRFYEVDDGRISVDGRDIRDIPKPYLRRQLGIVLQDTFLFSTTVMENIRYGRLDASDEEVIEAAKIADADHFIRQLPQGYLTMLSERASNLSQGQRQLLAIARAILADPRILILDEATSSVDTRTEARIQAALLRLMSGRTSFVIAHRLSTIRDADQVLVIQDGQIVERGTHHSLLAEAGFYAHLYHSQFKGQEVTGD